MTNASSISDRLHALKAALPAHVQLVAVSKTKPVELLQEALDAGQVDLGENRVQELVGKHEALTHADSGRAHEFVGLKWHQIGTLQKNKVKYIAPFVDLIHAVDQAALLDEIEKRAGAGGRRISVLLQMHIAQESSKFGLSTGELEEILERIGGGAWPNVEVKGLMGMATFTDDNAQVAREFGGLRQVFESHGAGRNWDTLSMGMSGDWRIAVDQGSTMVRIGSSIFGSR